MRSLSFSVPLTLLTALSACDAPSSTSARPGAGAAAQSVPDEGVPPDASPPVPDAAAPEICRPGDPTAAALEPGGPRPDGTGIIPGGRRITPAGFGVPLVRAPIGLALSPDGHRAFVTHDGQPGNALDVIDLDAVPGPQIVQTLSGFAAFRGVSATPDGAHLLVAAGASGTLLRFDLDANAQYQGGPALQLDGYLGALVVSPDGARAYVTAAATGTITEIDLATFTAGRVLQAGNLPYDLVLSPDGRRLFVSNLGDSTVQAFDVSDGAISPDPLATVQTPQGPEGMALDAAGDRLFVTCADDDVLLVLDTDTLLETATLDLSHHPAGLLASTPNDVVASPDGGRLYVAQADLNQVDVVDPNGGPDGAAGRVLGSMPTGWYPVAVEVTPDGERVVVLNAKGLGASPSRLEPDGLLQVIPRPDAPTLAAQTALVTENNTRPSRFYPNNCPSILPDPHPDGGGGPAASHIRHVVLIVRENKTYDMDLGDLEGANGDPALAIFGESITPNLHALARRFSNLDNYFSDPEESLQGHQWTTQADCGDFTEKLRFTQLPLAGYEPASLAASGNIFSHCLEHGVSFRNYGEVVSFGPELLGRYRDFIDSKYPFFDMGVRDEVKAREVIREWSMNIFPEFIYISLPNDHTFGTKPGKPTPESMVADNDRATGMLVDWISKSQYWGETAIFVIEDDPQSYAGDHVDAHRSLCLVLSPWVKTGFVSHAHADIASVYHTIELLLGLPPMNKNDDGAAPLYEVFRGAGEAPDLRGFDALPLAVAPGVNTAASPMAAESMRLNFDGVDGAAGLGRILWEVRTRGRVAPGYAVGVDR